MKKLLIIVIVMTLCCVFAFAEMPELNPEDMKLDLSEKHSIGAELENSITKAKVCKDTVSREGTSYIVDTGSLKLKLDMAQFPWFFTFTQDKFASSEAYLKFSTAMDSVLSYLIEQDVHFLLMEKETGLEIDISTQSDGFSAGIGDLNTLSEKDMKALISRNFPGATVYQAGENRWLQLNDWTIFTIANSQYVIARFGGSDDPAADLQDTLDVVSQMTIE